ncbi:MAG: BrnT family toxin, partial [bacterium]|nr:BrnT family toxin [bacterium]
VMLVEVQEVEGELRTVMIGMTTQWNVLYVVHTVRAHGVYRLISARRVTAVPCSRTLNTACRLRSQSDVISSPQRVDTVANTCATRDYVPYPRARLRA